ncbi:MAG: hypothetical protein GX678_03815 [Actinomycetales bacterium]|nr:hypothetical protein [Actinomycetales bacterium]
MSISTLSGSVTIRERIAIPDGSIATVKLVASDGEVLAATAFEVEGVPAEFDLYVDSEILKTAKKPQFWAMLRTDVGSWGTFELVSTERNSTEVLLTRIPE